MNMWNRVSLERKQGLRDTADGRNAAPPKKSWNDHYPASTNKRYGFSHGFKVVRTDFVTIHSII